MCPNCASQIARQIGVYTEFECGSSIEPVSVETTLECDRRKKCRRSDTTEPTTS